jgi:hypothetical protein
MANFQLPRFAITIGVSPFAHEEHEQDEDGLDREPEHAFSNHRFARGPDSRLVLPHFAPHEIERRIEQLECELKYLRALQADDHAAAERHWEAWFNSLGEDDDDER